MLQSLNEHHEHDADGNPTGGYAKAVGLEISWQHGPIGWPVDGGKINGTFIETVLTACLHRLEFYQQSRFACFENERAVGHLIAALDALEARINRRVAHGIQGEYLESHSGANGA